MRALLAAAAALVALAACQTVPLRPMTAPGPGARTALATLPAWHAAGRVAVRAGAAGWNASFDWRERGGAGELGVRGPFGAGVAHISRSADRIRIDGGGPPLELEPPFTALESELAARLGFALPIEALRYWILGIPAPDVASDGEGATFRQSGWSVGCSRYTAVEGLASALPTRLELSRGATRIRVIIDRWQVGGG